MSTTKELKEKLRKPKPTKAGEALYLSSGLSMLNLGLTGSVSKGLLGGHYYLLVGDSQAGKTWLSLMLLAEAANDPAFDKYRLILDQPERGALMDIGKYFGKTLAGKLEDPSPKGASKTLSDFYGYVDDAAQDGRPFIYVLDSEDALDTVEEEKKFQKDKRARAKVGGDDDAKGSYGTTKAKMNSTHLRRAHNSLEATGSILIVIKQTRDNIGFGAMFNPKTRSGGRALTFYATCELWFSIKGKIKAKVLGKDRTIGSMLRIQIKKNRTAGKDRTIMVPFYPESSHGLDDTGSLVEFLLEEGKWVEGKGGRFEAPEFEHIGSREKLITKIEEEGLEKQLKQMVVELWNDIEEGCAVERKRRYE